MAKFQIYSEEYGMQRRPPGFDSAAAETSVVVDAKGVASIDVAWTIELKDFTELALLVEKYRRVELRQKDNGYIAIVLDAERY